MPYPESQLLPISALQHMLYCPRQCALIHVEQVWVENRFTAEGRVLHAVADQGRRSQRGGQGRETGVPVRSLELGLTGVADVVEFHPSAAHGAPRTHFPVEFKRGKPKKDDADRVQLCAQGMCLEEMLGVEVPGGALFFGKNRRREDVEFDARLRDLVRRVTADFRELLELGATPPPAPPKKCARCSLLGPCRPDAARKRLSVGEYIRNSLLEE